MKAGAILPNDNLSIQQNERIMNHKKKDSNSHLNKFNNTVNYLEGNANLKQENTDYNSANKYGNSPRNLQEGNKNNQKSSFNNNISNNGNYDFSIKAKRKFENTIQTQTTPYSGVNTDNSDNFIKSNLNKQGDYHSHKIESIGGRNNAEYLSSAARFYDIKSKCS